MNCKRCHKDMQLDAPFCPWCGAKQERKTSNRTRGNGMGCVYKHRNRWIARIVVGWKFDMEAQKTKRVHEFSCGHKTKKEAEFALAELLSGKRKELTAPVLNHYWELYRDGELQKLSESKQTAYNIAWKKIKALHYKTVDTITVSDLRKTAEEVAQTFYTRRDVKTLLSHLFKIAGADGFASKDLPDYINLPKLNEKERQPFTELEQASIWRAYESGCKDARLPLVMIYTGMLPGEILKLRKEMIDWNEHVIRDIGIKTEVRKKAVVYVPDCIIPILHELCEEADNGKIFDMSEATFYVRYYAVLESAGCRRLTPYSCRHTTATALAITQNIAPQTIKKIMRWSTTRMLDRYAHPTSKDASDAINTIKDGRG